jgi:flagellar protein FliO/FliZ
MSTLFFINMKITDLTPSLAGQFFYIFLLVIIVALLAYYSTRLLASSRNIGRRGRKRNIIIVESIGVGMNAIVQVIKVGEKYFLIGVTKEQVNILAEIEESEIIITEPMNIKMDIPFKNILERYIKKENNSNEARDDES